MSLVKVKKSVSKYPDAVKVKSVFPKKRQTVFNEYGWGFKDSFFRFENKVLNFTGERYSICNIPFNKAETYLKEHLNMDVTNYSPCPPPIQAQYPAPLSNQEFCDDLKSASIDYSSDFDDRFYRCHGQASRDFYVLRYKQFKRLPDLVVWPTCHDDVVRIVELANKYNIVLIPFGGGTNITLSVNYTKDNNQRFYVSLDTTQMNRLLWVDKQSMLACFESGIAGQDLERVLNKQGLTLGHEPDSIEFSTLGGWVATRSSGMKQQTYGNIEDIVVSMKLVTSIGTMEKNTLAPRVSIGPDFDHVVLGSEGTLGVITDVVVKVCLLPQVRRCGSIMFPDFDSGLKCFREIERQKCKPSSLRLVDNEHFQLGHALNQNNNIFGELVDNIKKTFAQLILSYDMNKVSMATFVTEGTKSYTDDIYNAVISLGKSFGGFPAGPKYGERAYVMTLTICYIRDFFFDFGYLFDSIEPSVSWEKCKILCDGIKSYWSTEMTKRGFYNILAIRISQVYHDGVCVYLYYGIGNNIKGDQLEIFEELTANLRGVITASGGSLSHHHGIGKKNAKYYGHAVSKVGVNVFKSIKKELDPNNIFDVGNLVLEDDTLSAKL